MKSGEPDFGSGESGGWRLTDTGVCRDAVGDTLMAEGMYRVLRMMVLRARGT